jgi:hypothetical protein
VHTHFLWPSSSGHTSITVHTLHPHFHQPNEDLGWVLIIPFLDVPRTTCPSTMPSSAPPLPPTLLMPLGPLGLITLERRQHYKEETKSKDQIRFLAPKALQDNRKSDDVSSPAETEDGPRVWARSPPCCMWRMGISTFRL